MHYRYMGQPILLILTKLQKKVVRLMTFSDPLSHSLPLFKELEILTISEVFKMETSKFVFESLNHINPSQFHDFFYIPL